MNGNNIDETGWRTLSGTGNGVAKLVDLYKASKKLK